MNETLLVKSIPSINSCWGDFQNEKHKGIELGDSVKDSSMLTQSMKAKRKSVKGLGDLRGVSKGANTHSMTKDRLKKGKSLSLI